MVHLELQEGSGQGLHGEDGPHIPDKTFSNMPGTNMLHPWNIEAGNMSWVIRIKIDLAPKLQHLWRRKGETGQDKSNN